MGALDRVLANAAEAAAGSPSSRVRAAMRARSTARKGYDPQAAADLSVNAAVRQAAGGELPDAGPAATSVSADAAWDPAARNPNRVGPVNQARSTPVAVQVADDLEQTLLEAMDIATDADGVLGVNEQVFEDLERRLKVIGSGGPVEQQAVQILAQRYGVPAGTSLDEAVTTISEGLAGQRMSLYQREPNVIDSRLERVSDNPFPERPSSLEGFPTADEKFDPVEVEEVVRIPRFEYDQLGRLKVDGDGNPLPRIDPETNLPTFEPVRQRRLVPQRTVDGVSAVMPSGEFTTIGRRRSGSDGNRSAEEVVFVLDRGDGTYQLSRITDSGGYDNQIIDEGQLGRLLVETGYERISGPELGFSVQAPTEGDADALGKMLFESLQPGAATPGQAAEVVRRISEIGQVFDGALAERALRAAGFQDVGNELSTGLQLLERAREMAASEALQRAAPAPGAAAGPATTTSTVEVRPPRSDPSRGAVTMDATSEPLRRARDLSQNQQLLTPDQRSAQEAAEGIVSGPTGGQVDMVSGPADATTFLGPDGQPLTATFDPTSLFSDAAPPLFPPAGRFQQGILGGLQQYGIPASGPGSSSVSVGGVFGDGTVMDTGTLPGSVPVTMDASLSMPDRLDVLQGLSDVATPATPVMNFDFSGDWSRAAGRGSAVNATWRNKDYDQPVRVTGFAGEFGGVRYYTIEGSGTAIPEPELDFGGSAPPGATRSGPTVAGTVDVGGVDFARAADPDSADAAQQQFAELANREAATKAALNTFADEPTDDVVQIWRRMEELRAFEPAFAELDVTEQFEMARMSRDQLQELADDISLEISETPNPNTFTQSQSVASPTSGNQFSTAQNLPPVTLSRTQRVRQAADPSAPQATVSDDPSDVAFGMNPSRRPPSNRRATEQRATILQARLEAADRTERLLNQVEKMYSPPPLRAGEDPPLPSTPEQVVAFVRGSGDFFRLPKSDQATVLEAVASPAQATALMDSTIASKRAVRDELRALGPAPDRAAGTDNVGSDPLDTPDDVTDIPQQRDEAQAELDESTANAQFYNEQRANAGGRRALSLRRAQDVVRRVLGIKSRDRLPLAFRDYDSRFGRRISATDIQRLDSADALIRKYGSMTDEQYQALAARNTDLPASRDAHVAKLAKEWRVLARRIGNDTVQDAGSSGENQARLVQNLLSDNPQTRLQALRELFSVTGVRNEAGERAGEDGLQVLRMLANDPAYGSVENVLYDVLNRDQSIRNPELSRAPVVDESGASLMDRQRDQSFVADEADVRSRNTNTGVPPAAGLGPESLREVSRRLAEDIGPAEGRQLTRADLQEAGLEPTFLPDEGPAVRPSFIDRLRGYLPFLRRQADAAPASPQVVTRQGLDTAEQEIAAASTPEEMNAILARINSTREQTLARLDDTNDPPVADGDGVERSARQQIEERANALTATWRRRMERMQAAEASRVDGDADVEPAEEGQDSAFAAAYGEAIEAGSDMREAIRAGQAAQQAASAAAGVLPRKPVAGVAQEAVERLQEQAFRNASLHPVTAEQAAADGLEIEVPEHVAERVDYELRRRATARQIAAERGEEPEEFATQLPSLSVNLKQRRAGVSFLDENEKVVVLEGRLRTKDEPETDGPAPVPFRNSAIISWSPDGGVQIRQRRLSRNDPDPEWVRRQKIHEAAKSGNTAQILALIPPAASADDVAEAAGRAADDGAAPASPTARPQEDVMEDFSRPRDPEGELEEPKPYDSDELDSTPDEDRIGDDIEASLEDPVPGPGRRRAEEEYEAEQARKAGKGKRGGKDRGRPGLTARRAAAGAVGAGVVGIGGGSAVNTGLNALLGGAGGGVGMGFAPASAYGEEAPIVAERDINTSEEPAGSQVRSARQRLRYLTSQNPLPY